MNKINFKMWGKALGTLIKMESRDEWEALDPLSRWLIATRSAVTTVTIYACIMAGLLAWQDGHFAWVPFIVVTLGLFIAHGTNNILNDYTDFGRGVDKDDYFRIQYGVHPLVQGFWSKKQQLRAFYISGVLACAAGVYCLFYTHFSAAIIGLFAFGALMVLFYTWPLKYIGLGELTIFLIWGPIFFVGVYLVLAKGVWSNDLWNVALAGVPFGLSVASINVGKHIDKLDDDKRKGVGTLPVKIGEKAARYVNMASLILTYLVILYLVFVSAYFTPVMLIVFLAGKRAMLTLAVLTKPRPSEPPKEWPAWPTWFSGFAFYHNRLFGSLLILGILADALIKQFLPPFWPPW